MSAKHTCATEGQRVLSRLHQRVALAAGGELDDAVGVEIRGGDDPGLLRECRVVEASAAAADEPARLAVRCRQSGAHEELEGGQASLELSPPHGHGPECVAD